MTELASGDFITYRLTDDEGAPEQLGIVLRTSANDKADGSKDKYVELVGGLEKVFVPDHQCRKFDKEPEDDPNEVVGGSTEPVSGIKRAPTGAPATKSQADKTKAN